MNDALKEWNRSNAILTITLSRDTGKIVVDGPLFDKIFCLGLLEAAKIVIHGAPATKPDTGKRRDR